MLNRWKFSCRHSSFSLFPQAVFPLDSSPLPPFVSCPTTPMTQHLDAAPSNDHPAHYNDSQPASHEHTLTYTHTKTKHTQHLIFNSSETHVAIFFSLSLAGPIEQSLCLFSAVLHTLALISSSLPSLDVCAVRQKTHFLSSPLSFHLCLIPSFLVVCHREITETGTINRRPGRVLLLLKPAIKDIHHHRAIDNQALLSSFIP